MNIIVSTILFLFTAGWLAYLCGLRDKRFAFSLWFPITGTSFLGTLAWLWAMLGLLTAPRSGDAALGFAAMGAAILAGAFLICPIVLAISFWQRPAAGSYGALQVVPILVFYGGAILLYRPLSETLENRTLILTVLDTQKKPVAQANVRFETRQKSLSMSSLPSIPMTGNAETQADGTVNLPVPKTHEMDCTITRAGYADLRLTMDRAWGHWAWHQTTVARNFPGPVDHPWDSHGGTVQTDVDDANPMRFTVYLPTVNTGVPNYGPVRVSHEDGPGTMTWTPQPSVISYH